MPETRLNVTLVAYTPNPEAVVAQAARTCYSSRDIEGLQALSSVKGDRAMIRRVRSSGHDSIIEHAAFTFACEGVSRSLLAQITRHRMASFSVQSQRYVSFEGKGFDYITPPRIAALGEQAVKDYDAQMHQMQAWYDGWSRLLGDNGAEDARFVLPNAAATRITFTMNARELNHFFALRCCNRAQWEIRALAWAMLSLVLPLAPSLFELAGPPCLRGACPEGSRSCGKPAEVKAKWQAIKEAMDDAL